MARKTATQKTHLKSKHKVAKARRVDDPPLCWWWKEKDRVLFVDKTRDNRFAVYYVPDKYLSDRGQRKTRFTALAPQELRGYASGLVAGKVLGSLTGLPPAAQKTLANAGMYAGVVKSVLPMIYGMR